MNKEFKSACTSVMVGRLASADGATYIARNEDRVAPIEGKSFVVKKAVSGRHETYVSPYNKLTVPMPKTGMSYTCLPSADQSAGPNEEAGINAVNVGESATETVHTNDRILAYDPWVKNGFAEDSLTNTVLPFIHSAREGVEYVGKLIDKYGAAEGSGIQFNDQNDVWYIEIVSGHQWAAVRIPDDCYAVAANQVAIQDIDFSEPDNYQWAPHIREFVEEHGLNPDTDRWDFRHIFGTVSQFDHHYNTPRVWFAQRYLSPKAAAGQTPEDDEMPFIRKAERKIAVEDIQYILKSHYNETPYDPLGHGTEEQKKVYRSIALARTAESHIVSVNGQAAVPGVQWVEFGVPTFCPYVPFFTNANDTDDSYNHFDKKINLDNAFWLQEALAGVVESHYEEYMDDDQDFQNELNSWGRAKILAVNQHVKEAKLTGDDLTVYLTDMNHEIASHYNAKTKELLLKLLAKNPDFSKLTFKLDPTL